MLELVVFLIKCRWYKWGGYLLLLGIGIYNLEYKMNIIRLVYVDLIEDRLFVIVEISCINCIKVLFNSF